MCSLQIANAVAAVALCYSQEWAVLLLQPRCYLSKTASLVLPLPASAQANLQVAEQAQDEFCCGACVQATGVKEISEFVAQLRRVGKGLGVYEFDKFLAGKAVSMGAVDANTGVTPGAAE